MKRKINNFKLTIFLLFIVSVAGYSQNTRKLELEEVINLAINHSYILKQDSLNLKRANSKITQNKNSLLPQVSANLSYIRISDNITPFQVAFPTGNVVLNPQILNQSYNSLQLRQLVWAGGKVNNATKILKLESDATALELSKNKTEIDYTITDLWYNLYSVSQSIKIIEANSKLLSNQKKDAENFVKQGIILNNDVLKIDLAITGLNTNLSDLIATKNTLNYNLCMLTGIDTATEITIDEIKPMPNSDNLSSDIFQKSALNNRAELKILKVRELQTETELKIMKSNYLPVLTVGGSANYNQPEQRLFPNQPEFTATWNVGAFLTWNLTDLYATKEKVKESKWNISKTTTAFNQVKEGIMMEVNKNFNDYLQSIEKIKIAQKAVEQATENFRVEENKFKANTTTSSEYLDANTLLLQSKINKSTAIANSELAYKKLIKSTN